MFHLTSNILVFLKIRHLQAELRVQQGSFLHVIPVLIIFLL